MDSFWNRTRGWLRAIALAGAAACAGPQVEPPPAIELTRAVSYNIYWDNPNDPTNAWGARKHLVLDLLHELDADVIGLQETQAHQRLDIVRDMKGYRDVSMLSKEGVFDSMVLFRSNRYILLAVDHYWMSTTPDIPFTDDFERPVGAPAYGPRTATCVLLFDRGLHMPLLFCNTHWDGVRTIAEASARLMLQRVGARFPDVPTVMTGDLNVLPYVGDGWPTEPAWMAMAKNGAYEIMTSVLRDGYADLYPLEERSPSVCGWEPCARQAWDARIDYVLHSSQLEAVAGYIDGAQHEGRNVSDHMPVVADLRYKGDR